MEKQQPFFMVFVEGERNPTYKHTNLEMADSEAKRLSRLTSKIAYVLTTIKSISVPAEFIIEDLRPDKDYLPF